MPEPYFPTARAKARYADLLAEHAADGADLAIRHALASVALLEHAAATAPADLAGRLRAARRRALRDVAALTALASRGAR